MFSTRSVHGNESGRSVQKSIVWKLLVMIDTGRRERTLLMVIPECEQLTIISPSFSHQRLLVSEQRRLCQSFAAPLSCNIAM